METAAKINKMSNRKKNTLSKRGENVFSRDTFEPKNNSPKMYYNSPQPDLQLIKF
jgi:hypothetical protein